MNREVHVRFCEQLKGEVPLRLTGPVMERFFLNLKRARVWRQDHANHEEAIRDVTDYIVGFYNSQRLHSTLGYLPPNGYERKMTAQQPILVSEKT